jgi:hypothetical protein
MGEINNLDPYEFIKFIVIKLLRILVIKLLRICRPPEYRGLTDPIKMKIGSYSDDIFSHIDLLLLLLFIRNTTMLASGCAAAV